MPTRKFNITMCDGLSCLRGNSKQLKSAIEAELARHNLTEKVSMNISGCLGMCAKGPILIVNPGYTIYGHVSEKDIPEIIQEHIINKKPVQRLVIDEDHLYNRFFKVFGDVNFFGKQMRITLRNCGIIDPESIDDYLTVRGYEALAKVLTDMKPADVIAEVKKVRACAAGAARDSRPASSGSSRRGRKATRNTSYVTPTRATPGPSWTARPSRATRIPLLKA
jgi:NADH:ubiquinone oxidoreductase, NADH-binding (51 kD) subunit